MQIKQYKTYLKEINKNESIYIIYIYVLKFSYSFLIKFYFKLNINVEKKIIIKYFNFLIGK